MSDREPRPRRARDALGRPLPPGVAGEPPTDETALPPTEALDAAQHLLDRGRPFAAHEVLEAVWKAAPAEERDLWQGLAQLCVAATHRARGNPVGAAALLQRGQERLARAVPAHGVDLDGLLGWDGVGPLRLRRAG